MFWAGSGGAQAGCGRFPCQHHRSAGGHPARGTDPCQQRERLSAVSRGVADPARLLPGEAEAGCAGDGRFPVLALRCAREEAGQRLLLFLTLSRY